MSARRQHYAAAPFLPRPAGRLPTGFGLALADGLAVGRALKPRHQVRQAAARCGAVRDLGYDIAYSATQATVMVSVPLAGCAEPRF
jgi:hypothetical protein